MATAVKGRGVRLGPAQQNILVQLLASGMNQKEAAARLGVAPNTVHKWTKRPGFMDRVKEANARLTAVMMEETKAGITSLTMKARARLEQLLDSDETSDQILLSAIRTVYEYSLKFAEATTVTEKLDSLEGHVDEIKTRAEELTSVTAAA